MLSVDQSFKDPANPSRHMISPSKTQPIHHVIWSVLQRPSQSITSDRQSFKQPAKQRTGHLSSQTFRHFGIQPI